MSNNSKISNRTSKNILLGLGAALLIASCAQNEGWEQPSDSGKPNTQPVTKPVTKPTPQPESTPTTNQGQFLGLFAADITTDGQNITSSEVRPLSTGAALENIVLSVDNTINLKDNKTGVKHYLTTLNVINKSNKDIATPTFVPVATSRTNNTFFHSAKDKSGKASDPAGIIIEQGHHNSAGNIVVNPTASKLAAVNFAASSIVPKAGDKITKVSGKAWQSAALAQNASQKVQFGFMIPKANNTFRFSVLFAVMDSGATNSTVKKAKQVKEAIEYFKNDPKLSQDPKIKALIDYKGDRNAVKYATLKDNKKVPLLSNADNILGILAYTKGMRDQGQQVKRYSLYYPMLPKKIQAKYPTPDQAKSMTAEQIMNIFDRIAVDPEYTVDFPIEPINSIKAQEISALNVRIGQNEICKENGYVDGICRNFNWGLKHFTSPVKNQGQRGTCWAFASIAALESKIMRQEGTTPDLSEEYFIYRSRVRDRVTGIRRNNQGQITGTMDEGYWPHEAINQFANGRTDQGWIVPHETPGQRWAYDDGHNFSRTPSNARCSDGSDNDNNRGCDNYIWNDFHTGDGYRFDHAQQIDFKNQWEVLSHLSKGKPIIYTYGYFDENRDRSKENNPKESGFQFALNVKGIPFSGHAVNIIGFISNHRIKSYNKTVSKDEQIPLAKEDAAEYHGKRKRNVMQGYYIIKNSWGPDHGDAGLDYVSVGFVEQLGLSAHVLNFTPNYDTSISVSPSKISTMQDVYTDQITAKISSQMNTFVTWKAYNKDGTPAGSEVDFSPTLNSNRVRFRSSKAGTYILKATAKANSGKVGQVEVVVKPKPKPNQKPTANFTYTPTAPTVGQKVTFDATTSKDPDGTVKEYSLKIGEDGKVQKNATGTFTHSFTKAGDYKISLQVTDDKGAKSTTTVQTITVKAEDLTSGKVCKGNFNLHNHGKDFNEVLAKVKGCTEITGYLNIHNTQLKDLSVLSKLKKVGGYVHLSKNNALSNLKGLDNLETIGGHLHIGGVFGAAANVNLSSLEGLNKLRSIGSYLAIGSNSRLVNLKGLESLRTIGDSPSGGNLHIEGSYISSLDGLDNLRSVKTTIHLSGNSNLNSLAALKNIESLEGSLNIHHNPFLMNLTGLNKLSALKGNVDIVGNDALSDLSALNKLAIVRGHVHVSHNASLPKLTGFDNLTTVENLHISDNASLASLGDFKGLGSIRGKLIIHNNPTLTSLSGLNKIDFTRGLQVTNNTSLPNLKGLEGLSRIIGDVAIRHNHTLKSLDGLNKLESAIVGNVHIEENVALSSIAALKNVTAVNGTMHISSNNSLANLKGLEKLTSVQHHLLINDNPVLSSVQSLSGLTLVGNTLQIHGNDTLANLKGFNKLELVSHNLHINNNKNLTSIAALNNLKEVKGSVREINNNTKFDCSSDNKKPPRYFPLTQSTGNKVNCTVVKKK